MLHHLSLIVRVFPVLLNLLEIVLLLSERPALALVDSSLVDPRFDVVDDIFWKLRDAGSILLLQSDLGLFELGNC